MIEYIYNYPLLLFKDGDKIIYATKNDFGIVSKGGESFYKDLTVIDVYGNVFKIKQSKIKRRASFIICLKNLQRMWEMEFEMEQSGVITLEDLKKMIISHISKHPKHWRSLDTVENIVEEVNNINNFQELILMFQ